SNLAYFHRGNGAVFEARRDLDKAMEEYRVAITLREELIEKDPFNALWLAYVAPDYANLGRVLLSSGQPAAAIDQYQKEVDVRRRLAAKDDSNLGWQRRYAESQERLDQLRAKLAKPVSEPSK